MHSAPQPGRALEAQRAGSRIELLKRQFELKNLLLRAENAYWNLVSLNQIVRLQEENVARAKKLNDWMSRRVGMRLVDDVDGLQAKASLEMRDLELQTSLDDRAVVARQFNILRGVPKDDVEPLAELPDPATILKGIREGQRMTREDFRMIFEQAEAGRFEAKAARSQIAPQLDLVGGVATNGLDRSAEISHEELRDLRNPTWNVGVVFSIPLDYSLIGNMKRSYQAGNPGFRRPQSTRGVYRRANLERLATAESRITTPIRTLARSRKNTDGAGEART
jgi:outer membrane protein TolC